MKAMVLKKIWSFKENKNPLELVNLPDPLPEEKEILVKVSACGVCHTELDEIEGRTPPPRFPVVPGHEVVGRVEKTGSKAGKFKIGLFRSSLARKGDKERSQCDQERCQ